MASTFIIRTGNSSTDNGMEVMDTERYLGYISITGRTPVLGRINPAETGDSIIYMECTAEQQKILKREENRSSYREEMRRRYPHTEVGYDEPAGPEEDSLTWAEKIADPDMDTEEQAYTGMVMAELGPAVENLTAEEQEIVRAVYLEGDGMSIMAFAARKGITRAAARYLHGKALKKLQDHYKKKKLL